MESTKALPGVFSLIKQSLSFYKKNFKKLVAIGATLLVLMVVEGLIMKLLFPGISDGNTFFITLSAGSRIFFVVLIFIGAIVNVVAQIIIQISFIKAASEYDGGASASVKDIFRSSFSLFWSFIWVTILSALVFFGSGVFLLVPAIILGIYMSMSTYVLVIDGKKGLSALTTSFHYVRGNWWRVLGRVLAMVAILLVIALVVVAIVLLIVALSGAISFASMNDFIASVVTLAEALDKSEVINLLIGIVMNFIAYCVLAPICTFYSYSIYKHLKAKKSAPEATELKTVRAWFMGLSIFGLVVSVIFIVFMTVIPLIFATMSGFNAAKMRAEMQNQGYQNTSQVQDSPKIEQSSIIFPTKAEPLINSNLSSLESKAYSDPDYKFSMNLPSGFITQDIQSGVSVIDPREKVDAVINIIARDLTEDKKTTSEIDLVKIVFGRLIDGSGITNITYKTLTVGGVKAYAAEGSVLKNGQTVNARYYVITHGNIFYIIIGASTDNPGELKALQMVVDSVSTFKAL